METSGNKNSRWRSEKAPYILHILRSTEYYFLSMQTYIYYLSYGQKLYVDSTIDVIDEEIENL